MYDILYAQTGLHIVDSLSGIDLVYEVLETGDSCSIMKSVSRNRPMHVYVYLKREHASVMNIIHSAFFRVLQIVLSLHFYETTITPTQQQLSFLDEKHHISKLRHSTKVTYTYILCLRSVPNKNACSQIQLYTAQENK